MSHLDPLISDLALILAVAGITTLLFKRLKQPVVLGYVVAGFLCSGNFLLKGVSDMANVDLWAQIGIIFLLFSLGLEFSFKKLVNVGGPALLTALVIITGMMCTGFMAGKLLGWTSTDSVFLGGMLSMSSTTIIIKAFDDLGAAQSAVHVARVRRAGGRRPVRGRADGALLDAFRPKGGG